MNIALVVPGSIAGGVTTVFHNLYKGLISEGFQVSVFRLGGKRFPLLSTLHNDLLTSKRLTDFDLALYVGSIPWPSHMLAKLSGVPIALFLHGYVYHELLHVMLHGERFRDKMGAAITMTMFDTATSFNTVDLYICHSLTTCEANNISDRFILMPQWIFPEELKFSRPALNVKKNTVHVVTYTSYADSPRLLNVSHLLALAQAVERMVKREFKLVIIDPKIHISSFGLVKIVRPMPRRDFLTFLASADLYIETCIDEELRQTALEAMAIGTPVAKLTHEMYWNRQDYKGDLILARSFRELAESIADYINNVECYRCYYSKCGREFVLTKRTWNAVKGPFLKALENISQLKR